MLVYKKTRIIFVIAVALMISLFAVIRYILSVPGEILFFMALILILTSVFGLFHEILCSILDKKIIKAVNLSENSRSNCPFYGFFLSDSRFVDLEKDVCPFIKDYLDRSCLMKKFGLVPDWRKCSLNNEGIRKEISPAKNDLAFFPKELKEVTADDWQGIEILEWIYYIMEGRREW